MRAVVDSSVLVSAFLTPEGTSAALLTAGLTGCFEAWISPLILAETSRRLFHSRRLRGRYEYTSAEAAAYLDSIIENLTVATELPELPRTCRDPNDDHVLAAAIAAAADWIVTGDRDLLDLRTFRGVEILGVRAAIDRLDT